MCGVSGYSDGAEPSGSDGESGYGGSDKVGAKVCRLSPAAAVSVVNQALSLVLWMELLTVCGGNLVTTT